MSIFYRKNLKNYFKQYSKSKIKLPNNSILCLISSASRLNLCSEQNDNSDNNLFLSVFHLFIKSSLDNSSIYFFKLFHYLIVTLIFESVTLPLTTVFIVSIEIESRLLINILGIFSTVTKLSFT